jgi:hypothetical protein
VPFWVDGATGEGLSSRWRFAIPMPHPTFHRVALAALAGLVAGQLMTLPVQAAHVTPSQLDTTHPEINRTLSAEVATPPPPGLQPGTRALPLVPNANGPQREVFGFVSAGALGDPTVGYPSWDFSMLTTVAYFGVHVNWDGHLVTGDTGWAVWNSSTLTALVNKAHSQGVKVVLTLILMDGGGSQPLMCSGLGWGGVTITEATQQIAAKGVDGINLDYEGQNAMCVNNQTTNSMLVGFVHNMRAAMPPGSYLSIDSYSGSGEGPDGFFNLPALAPNVDSFFVMAYDMEYYNWIAFCSRMCLGPTSPISGYFPYNDTRTAAEYSATVPASKVILGVPYYGRKACVGPGDANAYPTSPLVADSYLDASTEYSYFETAPGTYSVHRDIHDAIGQERFDDWLNTTLNCTRQLYWDDFVSLGAKYDLVNRYNLRGVGIFTLNYGGGAPELWCDLRDHFTLGHIPATAAVNTTQSTTKFTVNITAGQGCGVSAFDLQQQDTTINQPWMDVAPGMRPTSYVNQTYSATFDANSYQGHNYQFRVRTVDGNGYVGAWSQPVSTAVPSSATLAHPYKGMFELDAYGAVFTGETAPVVATAYWPGWRIARAGHARPGPTSPQSGAVLDGYGGLHPYGTSFRINSPSYWQGWDIARDFAFLPDGSGGYVLDGFGGLHPFTVNGSLTGFGPGIGTMPPPVQGNAYWPNWDIARKVVIFSDGTGGYVLDGYGGVHSFGIGKPAPPNPNLSAYWPNWDIAHDFAIIPGTHSGYVMDGYGGLHAFAPPGQALPATITGSVYWSGWDIARGIWLLSSSTTSQPAGYLVDGYGGFHPLGAVPAVSSPYWPGHDNVRNVWGA